MNKESHAATLMENPPAQNKYVNVDWLLIALKTYAIELVLSLVTLAVPMWYQIDSNRASSRSPAYEYRNLILLGWLVVVILLFTYGAYHRLQLRQQKESPDYGHQHSRFAGSFNVRHVAQELDVTKTLDGAESRRLLMQVQSEINALIYALAARPLMPLDDVSTEIGPVDGTLLDQRVNAEAIDLRDKPPMDEHLPADHHIVFHVFLPQRRATAVLPRYLTAPGGPTQEQLEILAQTLQLADALEWETENRDRYFPKIEGPLGELFPIWDHSPVHLWQAPVRRQGVRSPDALITVLGPIPEDGASERLIKGVDGMIRSAAEILSQLAYEYHFIAARYDNLEVVDLTQLRKRKHTSNNGEPK